MAQTAAASGAHLLALTAHVGACGALAGIHACAPWQFRRVGISQTNPQPLGNEHWVDTWVSAVPWYT